MSALLLAHLAFAAIGLPDGALGIAWPSLRDAFRLPQSGLALILTAQTAGYLVAGYASAAVMRRADIGRVLAVSTAIVALAATCFAIVPTLVVLPLAAFVLGLGSATIDASLNGHAAAHFSAKHLNWVHAAYGVGAAFGPVVMTWGVATGGDWRLGYGVLATTLAALALLFWRTRGRWGRTPPLRTGPRVGSVTDVPARQRREAWLQIGTFAVYTGIEAAAGQWSFAVLHEGRGLPLAVAGAGTAVFWTCLCLGRFAVGFVADRLGAARLVRLGGLGTLAGALAFARVPGEGAIAGLALMGTALAPVFPMLMLRTAERFEPRLAARLFGLQVSAAMLGALALPSMAGLAADVADLGAIPPLLVAAAAVHWLMVHHLTRTDGVPGRARP